MKISQLKPEDRSFAQKVWEEAHTDGVSSTGLGQALMLAAAHARLQADTDSETKNRLERIDDVSSKLYGQPVSPIVARIMDEPSSQASPLTAIRTIGRVDGDNDNILRARAGGKDETLVDAARNAFVRGSPEGFDSSRWAIADRHYWEGVARVLSYRRLEAAGQGHVEAIERDLDRIERTTSLDDAVLRFRDNALRALADTGKPGSRKPAKDAVERLASATYGASTAEERGTVASLMALNAVPAEVPVQEGSKPARETARPVSRI